MALIDRVPPEGPSLMQVKAGIAFYAMIVASFADGYKGQMIEIWKGCLK
jgi:hypothetical protein